MVLRLGEDGRGSRGGRRSWHEEPDGGVDKEGPAMRLMWRIREGGNPGGLLGMPLAFETRRGVLVGASAQRTGPSEGAARTKVGSLTNVL